MPLPSLEWQPRVADDLQAIYDYIAQDNPAAARKLIGEIKLNARRLRRSPGLGRLGRVPGTRELVVRKNYIVVYSATETLVSVLSVRHGATRYFN